MLRGNDPFTSKIVDLGSMTDRGLSKSWEIGSPLRLIGFGGLRPTQRYSLGRARVLHGSEGQLGFSQ